MTARVLWYRKPAAHWVEALPIGTGKRRSPGQRAGRSGPAAAAAACARGGFVVELSWHDQRLTRAQVRSLNGNRCQMRHGGRVLSLETAAGVCYDLTSQLCDLRPSAL
jgi:hypothetical protein